MEKPLPDRATRFQLNGREVDATLNLIDGERVEPKAMGVLLALADVAPDPVTPDELLDRVWGDTVVVDNVVHKAIARLRRAFNDDAQQPRVIETIPRRGYRLIAEIEHGEPESASPELRTQPGNASEPERTIAVLPFKNLSDDESQEFFVEGVTEDILNGLGHLSAIRVIGRASSFQFDSDAADVVEVGKLLGVTHVVQGGVRRVDDRVRVTARLMSTADGAQLWSNHYDRRLDDIFAVQDEIAGSILEALHYYFEPPGTAPTQNLAAYAAYVEGRCLQAGGQTRRADLAEAAFERALALDPTYADAHSAVAGANIAKVFNRIQAFPTALAVIKRHLSAALEVDPTHLGARSVENHVRFFVERDFQGAIDRSVEVLEQNPNASASYLELTVFCRAVDRNDVMVDAARRLVALDPLNAMSQLRLAEDLTWVGFYDEALSAAEAAEKRGYPAAHLIFNAALRMGDEVLLARQIDRPVEAWDSAERRLLYLAELARDNGDAVALQRCVAKLKPLALAERKGVPGPSNIRPLSASVALLEGDPTPALDWFEDSITASPQGIWLAPAGPCRDDQPRGIDLDRQRYPEVYADPQRDRILEKYVIDKASILEITVPELPV